MTDARFLKLRLPALFVLLVTLEIVNLVKLSVAFSWTNHAPLGIVAAIALGAFLVGSIIAMSFPLEADLKKRLERMVVGLFALQTVLVCIVSFLHSLTLMPADQISQLAYTPPEATRRVLAVLEGAATNIATFAFWGVLGGLWRAEIQQRTAQLHRLLEFDVANSPVEGAR